MQWADLWCPRGEPTEHDSVPVFGLRLWWMPSPNFPTGRRIDYVKQGLNESFVSARLSGCWWRGMCSGCAAALLDSASWPPLRASTGSMSATIIESTDRAKHAF